MKLYKLTDAKRRTGHSHHLTTWRKGFQPPRLSGEGGLCGSGWYHAYDSPLLAVLHNPIHANFIHPRCCVLDVDEADIGRLDRQMKVGYTACTVEQWIKLPKVTTEQRIRYALLCALSAGYRGPRYIAWICKWWSNEDRSKMAAAAAYADAAAAAAADAADAAAADAADAAADAARFESLKKSADICRKYLTEEVLNKYKKL